MEERKRSIQKKFRLTEQENLRLCVKMGHAHAPSFQYYARKMCLDGKVMRVDYGAIRELTREVHKIGVNINQMARYINQYPDLATATSFRFYERAYKNLEDKVLELLERVA